MTAEETRLAIALAAGPPGALLLAALFSLIPAPRRRFAPARWLAGLLLVGAVAGALGALVLSASVPPATAAFDATLFTWSPLGLYGVTFGVHPTPAAAVLSLPPLVLALAGWQRPARHGVSDAAALLALAGALWTVVAADLVSQYLGVTIFLLGTAAVLWAVAGDGPAGRRLVMTATTTTGLLACVLLLGKVNGLFALSQLSTAGFTSAAFFGLALGAAVAAGTPPFDAWLQRIARHPYAAALAAGGVVVALALLLMAFRTTAGSLAPAWQRWLVAYGWLATLIPAAVALRRRSPATRLAALFAGKAGLLFFASAIATPAAAGAAVLYASLTLPAHGLLWWLAGRPGSSPAPRVPAPLTPTPPVDAPAPADTGAPAATEPPALPGTARARAVGTGAVWRSPSFWIVALLLASAAALPGTVGGAAGDAFVRALTSWPSGDLTLRVPPFLLDATLLAIGGGLLWGPERRSRGRAPLAGWPGWVLLFPIAILVIAPAVFPARLIGRWFGPVAAAAAGTGTAPLSLELSPFPSVLSGVLAVLALWALVQRLRGREWIPGPVHGLVGILALLGAVLAGAWRRSRLATTPARLAGDLWARSQGVADRVMGALRPFEERYYAAAAVMVAVALIYIIGR